MGGLGAFTGPVVIDLIAWGIGGQLFGGILGFFIAETWKRLVNLEKNLNTGEIATRAAWAGATFAVCVAAMGHFLRGVS